MGFDGKYYRSGRRIIKEIMKEKGITKAELGRWTGATKQLVNKRLNTNVPHDIPADVLALCLRVMGYTLIAVPMDFKMGDRMFFIKWQSGKNRKGQAFVPDPEEEYDEGELE